LRALLKLRFSRQYFFKKLRKENCHLIKICNLFAMEQKVQESYILICRAYNIFSLNGQNKIYSFTKLQEHIFSNETTTTVAHFDCLIPLPDLGTQYSAQYIIAQCFFFFSRVEGRGLNGKIHTPATLYDINLSYARDVSPSCLFRVFFPGHLTAHGASPGCLIGPCDVLYCVTSHA